MTAVMVAGAVPQTALAASSEETEESTEVASVEAESEAAETKSETVEDSESSTEAATEETSSQESSEENASEESTSEETSEQASDAAESESTEETTTEKETTEEETTEEELADVQEAVNKALRFKVEPTTAWKDFIQQDVAGFSDISFEGGKVNPEYSIGYDLYMPKTESFEGTFGIKTVTKRGEGWKWIDNGTVENLTRDSFTECSESGSLVKYTYKAKIGDVDNTDTEQVANNTNIVAVVVDVFSKNISYDGAMFVDNVTLYDENDKVVRAVDFNDSADAVELGDLSGMEPEKEPENEKLVYKNDFNSVESLEGMTLAEIATGNKAIEFTTDLTGTDGWTNIFGPDLKLETAYTESITGKLNMTYDVYFPVDSIDDTFKTMKAKAAVKSGTDWNYVSQKSWPEFTTENLMADEAVPGYKKLSISIDMFDLEKWDNDKNANVPFDLADITPIQAVVPCLAGDTSAYKGKLYLDNVVLTAYDKEEGSDVEDREDLVLSMSADNWSDGGAWDYLDAPKTITNETVGEKNFLKVGLDYSGYTDKGWSEAKLEYTHPETVASMTGYNTFKADFYYKPDNKTAGGFKIKIYDETLGLNNYLDVPVGTAVEGVAGLDGYYKSQFVLPINPKEASFEKLIFGIIGVNTDYKGDIYLDNVRFTQTKESDAYVDTTIKAQKGAGITVSEDGRILKTASGQEIAIAENVALVDADAIDATKQLYAYLKAVGESDSVIFGHQNDTHHKAGSGDTNSDTKDVTGSISGVVGIDTLSLTGNEATEVGANWDTPQSERVAVVAKLTREAAAEGALITLSAHMPNFDLIDQRVKAFEAKGGDTSDTLGYWVAEDGTKTYNFSGYTPNTVSGNVVARIMPGQDLNYLYTAYLDMIAEYAKAVEGDGITILFRPLHENTGSWFWWGAAQCDEQSYINLYRYTVDYLKETKGVHNMLYVYGPGSEAENTTEYAARYPGDAYVDMVGYDMYHSTPTADNEATYLANIHRQNEILKSFATAHNKLYAITETGVANDSKALLKKDNEVKDWYMQLLDQISADGGICYFLVWANWGENDAFYTPFVKSFNEDGSLHGHEMLDEFIKFYNDGRSVFASDMNSGFKSVKGVTNTTTKDEVSGYIIAPLSGSRILTGTTLIAKVNGVPESSDVTFEIHTDYDETVISAAYNKETGNWEANLPSSELLSLGKGIGTITLKVAGKEISDISVIFNEEEPVADPMIPEDFESYNGSDRVLNNTWATNKDTGSGIVFSLTDDKEKVFGGNYGLQMDFTLATKTAWAGATKNLSGTSWAAGNALEFYTIPEANGQKVVVQVTSAGNIFEVYMQEYANYTECGKNNVPAKVTVPFSAFVGRDNKKAVFDPTSIDSIGLWCNAIAKDDVKFPLQTTICYDELRIVTTDKTEVTLEPLAPIATEGISIAKIADATYTGKAIKPAVTVYDGKTVLKLNKDYSVKYENNTNAGVAKITVKGKGDYKNKINETVNFNILPKSSDKLTVVAPEYLAWKNNDKEQTVNVKVKDGSKTLQKNKDYTLKITFDDNGTAKEVQKAGKAGKYTITVTPKGNYGGPDKVSTFYVEKRTLLTKASVKLPSSSLKYNDGNPVVFTDESKIVVKVAGKKVPTDSYVVSYENNVKVGKATVVITAKADSDYAGYVKKTFKITGIALNTRTVKVENFVSSMTYSGRPTYQQVKLSAKADGTKLVKNVDYTLSYINNKNAGKAKLVIKGKGKYTGTITKYYTIKKVTLTKEMLSGKAISVEQNKAGAKPDVTLTYNGMKLVNGRDYTLTYTNNKEVTTQTRKATITIKAKGNYSGTLKNAVTFTITPKSLQSDDVVVKISGMKYSKNKKDYRPTVVVLDNGRKLTCKKDYTITYAGNKKDELVFNEKGEATAQVVITAVKGSSYDTGKEEMNTVTKEFIIKK